MQSQRGGVISYDMPGLKKILLIGKHQQRNSSKPTVQTVERTRLQQQYDEEQSSRKQTHSPCSVTGLSSARSSRSSCRTGDAKATTEKSSQRLAEARPVRSPQAVSGQNLGLIRQLLSPAL